VFSGVDAVNVIRKYRANKAFFGATGYEMKHGLTCSYVEECPLKQAFMESSVERILLLDSTKFGKVSTCSFAPMKDFSVVITDQGIPRNTPKTSGRRARTPDRWDGIGDPQSYVAGERDWASS
jgi:DeoR/GlpR family transcriptional regulator of sugar metabolism